MSWGERLRLVHLLLSVGAMLQYGGQGRVLMVVLVVNLLCAWTRFMRCGLYHRLERLCDLETDNINTKNYLYLLTKGVYSLQSTVRFSFSFILPLPHSLLLEQMTKRRLPIIIITLMSDLGLTFFCMLLSHLLPKSSNFARD